MKSQNLYDIFIHQLEDTYNAEQQIVEALPKLAKAASFKELKEAFTKHLKETEAQIKRLEDVVSHLGISMKEITCKGMEGLIEEADELIKHGKKSAVLDAALIGAAQKVEHYEIAAYGTLYSFATYLDLDSDILALLQENLDEEKAADKKLTKIAEGSLFSSGVNKEAAETLTSGKKG